jgi:hypothetical protein
MRGAGGSGEEFPEIAEGVGPANPSAVEVSGCQASEGGRAVCPGAKPHFPLRAVVQVHLAV